MRKRYWAIFGIMALSALGNIIGGTDTPATARVNPAGAPSAVQTLVPAEPRFEANLFVSANRLNLREGPTTGARVIASLPRNMQVLAGERQGGWVLVSANGQVGWVSADYLSGTPAAAVVAPVKSQSRQPLVQQQTAGSCPSRQYCTRIGTCAEARWYLVNCSWGHKLDSDSDGVPCEAICR